MKHIAIDFSRPYFKHRASARGMPFAVAALYAAALVLLVVLGFECLKDKKSLNKQSTQIQELSARLQTPVLRSNAADPSLSAAKTQAQNAAIQKLNLPWRDLLHSVEGATPKDIALLSLEPDASKSTLVIVAEAANPQAMLDYVSQLKAQSLFAEVGLVMHEMSKQDPFSPYRFQIEARWREVAP